MKKPDLEVHSIKPPLYTANYQNAETMRALRSGLSLPLSDGTEPMAICQTATRTEDRFLFLNDTSFFGLHPSSKALVHRPFGELKGLDRERAGSLAIDLQSDFNPYAAFNAISQQSKLGRDRYMDKSVTYHVLRFANIAVLMWDMPESRARKIFAHPCDSNPLAAFGVLVLPPASSSHARLSHMRALEEAYRFLVLYARYAFPNLNIQFEPQSLPDRR